MTENGKKMVGVWLDMDTYIRYKESGMKPVAVFRFGLIYHEANAKARELAELVNTANAEIARKNEKIYFLGEKLKESHEKLAEYVKKEEAQECDD